MVGDPVGFVVVVELDYAMGGQVEGDVRAVELSVEAVVLGPRFVEGGFILVTARGQA